MGAGVDQLLLLFVAVMGGNSPVQNAVEKSTLEYGENDINLQTILEAAGEGILVTGFNGGNYNRATGYFSYGVEGFFFKDGKIAAPVKEMLITGDMGFLYDSNALAIPDIPPALKIVVMKNGGGNIFRFLKGTSQLPELERYFETVQEVNVKALAQAGGFEYFKAENETALREALPLFLGSEGKSLLEIETPRCENDKILRNYFKQ